MILSDANADEVLLLSVTDEREAEIVRSLLDAHGITALLKHRGSGDYLNIYMGMSNLGIDIFVLEDDLVRAKELLNFNNKEELSDFAVNEEDNFISTNSKIGLFIFAILVILLIVGYIANI